MSDSASTRPSSDQHGTSDAPAVKTNGSGGAGAFGTTDADAAAVNAGREAAVRQRAVERLTRRNGTAPDTGEIDEEVALLLKYEDALTAFNRDHAIVNTGGEPLVVRKHFDSLTGHCQFEFSTFENFKKLYIKERVQGPDKKGWKLRKTAEEWLHWKDGRLYRGGIKLLPPVDGKEQQHGADILNRWCGFGIEPKPGDWSAMKRHIKHVVCVGKAPLFNYLLNWMALLVQSPGKAGQVAIVLIGPEGSGKGFLGRTLVKLLGQHGIHVTEREHLVGRFNGHLQDAVFIFADEAFFAHDVKSLSVLKSMITEPELLVEAKYRNPERVPNYRHLMIATNADIAAEMSKTDRRYAPFLVDYAPRASASWFAKIERQLNNGGYAAMLHDLLCRNISKFNVWDIPQSEARTEQMELSFKGFEAWYYAGLRAGGLCVDALGDRLPWDDEPSTQLLYWAYQHFAKAQHDRHPLTETAFGIKLSKVGVPPAVRASAKKVIRYDARDNYPIEGDRPMYRPIGTLDDARKEFANRSKVAISWPT